MTRLEFDVRIKALNLSRKDFAELAKVSYTGISTNWKDNKAVPAWVEPFLNYYEKSLELDKILKVLQKYATK